MFNRSQITVIDSTLREGRQSETPYLIDENQALDHIDYVVREGIVRRFELFTPGPDMSDVLFGALVKKYPDDVQAYCGPVETFSASKYPCLRMIPSGLLSLTLLRGHSDLDGMLRRAISSARESTFRIGIECAGEYPKDELVDVIRRIDAHEAVRHITVNDSNGRMDPPAVTDLTDNLPATRAMIGFHFHDDRGLEHDNLKALLRSRAVKRGIAVDCTLGGLGERTGITDLLDFLPYLQPADAAARSKSVLGRFRYRRQGRTRPIGRQATSHYSDGRLREEYQR